MTLSLLSAAVLLALLCAAGMMLPWWFGFRDEQRWQDECDAGLHGCDPRPGPSATWAPPSGEPSAVPS